MSTITLGMRKGENEGGYGGRLVDENMIVLRRRIHEKKMVERNYEPPEEWAEWEKTYYTCYDSDVCKAVGLLQTLLMSARPSVGIGAVALVALSVPTSAFFLGLHLVEMVKAILQAA